MTRPSDIPEEIYERADILCDQFRNIEDDRELIARVLMEVGQGAHAGLTARQRDALAFVARFIDQQEGVSPTIREIADALQLTLSRAHSVTKQLERRGFIAMVPRCHRSISIVGRS